MSIWEFINPGDAYDKGYAYGLADGKGGKRKNAPWQEEIKYHDMKLIQTEMDKIETLL